MNKDYQRIARAIRFIDEHRLEQPDLDQVAAQVGLSPHHFQRLFTRWAGVSPKKFLGFLTVRHARDLLAQGDSVLDTALDVGLSGPSRLHDLTVNFEAMTPGEIKNGGAGLSISYVHHETPFGTMVVMRTPRGICGLEFIDPSHNLPALVKSRWPGADVVQDRQDDPWIKHLFSPSPEHTQPVHLYLKGTNFQMRVWQALLSIPSGHVCTYKRIAEKIGVPKAARAVGSAIGANPVAVLIPCHRVIKQTGLIEGYRWGSTRKHALLGWESAHFA